MEKKDESQSLELSNGQEAMFKLKSLDLNMANTSLGDLRNIASILLDGNLIPTRLKNVEAVLSSIMAGRELGLKPFVSLHNIYSINGRPVIDYKVLLAMLASRNIFCEMLENRVAVKIGETTDYRTTVKVIRYLNDVPGGRTITEISSIYLSEVRKQVATQDVLNKYPEIMMRKSAFRKALPWVAADIIHGFIDEQEAMELANKEGAAYTYELNDDGSIKSYKNEQ
jgi:hypothetical protein